MSTTGSVARRVCLPQCEHVLRGYVGPANEEVAGERGLLLGKGGIEGNVLRVKPPLCVTREDVEFLAEVIDECLESA